MKTVAKFVAIGILIGLEAIAWYVGVRWHPLLLKLLIWESYAAAALIHLMVLYILFTLIVSALKAVSGNKTEPSDQS